MLYKAPFDRSIVRIKTRRGDWRNSVNLTGPESMGQGVLDSAGIHPQLINMAYETDMYNSPYARVKLRAGIEDIMSEVIGSAGIPTLDLQSIIQELVDFVKDAGSTVSSALNTVASTATTSIETAASGVTDSLVKLQEVSERELTDIFSTAITTAKELGTTTVDSLRKASETALSEGARLSNTVVSTGENAIDTMNEVSSNTISTLQKSGQTMIDEIKDTLTSELEAYKLLIETRVKEVVDKLNATAENIKGTLGDSQSGTFFQKNKKPLLVAIIIFICIAVAFGFFAIYLRYKSTSIPFMTK